MQTNTVLVTGGAGYVGSHTCKVLAEAGITPVTYDNLSTGHEWAVKWGPLEQGDILDNERLESVARKYRPSAVIHFAALAYVGESMRQPARYWQNNVLGSLSILKAMQAIDVPNIVFSSSCAVYGIAEAIPLVETMPKNPSSPYGTTKLVVEKMLGDFGMGKTLNSISLRYFNAAGADPEGEIGECHEPETHLIPLVLGAAKNNNQPLTIFGDDYPTRDGSCVRDYVHVVDLADAHLRALRYLEQNPGSHAFNLGNGKGYSVFELMEAARAVTGQDIPFNVGERRPGDPPELVSNSDLARSQLGWAAKQSDMLCILESAWCWMCR